MFPGRSLARGWGGGGWGGGAGVRVLVMRQGGASEELVFCRWDDAKQGGAQGGFEGRTGVF